MSADTTNTAKSGLDVLFAAIDYQQSSSSDETTPSLSLPSSSTSSKQPTPPNQNPAERVSVNPFRSKMDPRMRKSIEARALNPNMLDEEAVLAGSYSPSVAPVLTSNGSVRAMYPCDNVKSTLGGVGNDSNPDRTRRFPLRWPCPSLEVL
ncbi:hypothetical protein QTG54_015372 [Skeletonema marinoi]|uniref:Uncharacterized protein n=1 Tax=Skeletonema marinoi TaxID=267567 RepID=A0AAD9D5N8_9STRA|nr:hypothetical protein QTG54_015372 [Skeletonema marinoi]